MSAKSLREFLFVDQTRLNCYVEQIASPRMVEKIPTWKVAFGLLKLDVEATQTQTLRERTLFEKVTAFEQYLEENNLLRFSHVEEWNDVRKSEAFFVKETINANLCVLPKDTNIEEVAGWKGMKIWIDLSNYDPKISEPNRASALYLIEDLVVDDQTPLSMSSYSTIAAINSVLRKQPNKNPESSNEPSTNITNEKKEIKFSPKSKIKWIDNYKFPIDPLRVIAELDATVFPARKLNVVYRIRDTFCERSDNRPDYPLITIGYPIYIWV